VILCEETLFQDSTAAAGGAPLVELFQQQGIVPGIKVDQGVEPLAGALEGESWCTGLKGLGERAARYYARGARFAKWRAVLQISASGAPSELAVRENAWGLARYARTVQEQGLVPIVDFFFILWALASFPQAPFASGGGGRPIPAANPAWPRKQNPLVLLCPI